MEPNVKKSGRAPSQRQLRVGEVLRHSLSEVFLRGETGVSEIDQAGLTVLEVTMSPDLKNATAYVMPLGGKNAPKVLEALDEMRKRIRGLLSKKVKLKHMPQLSFKIDSSIEYATKINRLLGNPSVVKDVASAEQESAE